MKKVKRQRYWYKLVSCVRADGSAQSYFVRPYELNIKGVFYREGVVTTAPDNQGDLFLFKTLRELNAVEPEWSYARVIPIGTPLKATNPKAKLPDSRFIWPNGSYLVKAVKVIKIIKRGMD